MGVRCKSTILYISYNGSLLKEWVINKASSLFPTSPRSNFPPRTTCYLKTEARFEISAPKKPPSKSFLLNSWRDNLLNEIWLNVEPLNCIFKSSGLIACKAQVKVNCQHFTNPLYHERLLWQTPPIHLKTLNHIAPRRAESHCAGKIIIFRTFKNDSRLFKSSFCLD